MHKIRWNDSCNDSVYQQQIASVHLSQNRIVTVQSEVLSSHKKINDAIALLTDFD